MNARNGNYPAPPFMPERLSGEGIHLPWLFHTLEESDAVDHAYIQDGYPGPCVLYYRDNQYRGYDIGLWIERAECAAARRMGAAA